MPADIHFDAAARREFLKIRRWYAGRSSERIAVGFAAELDRVLTRIVEDVNTGNEFRTRYRWIRLRRYPYLVYYRVVDPATVLVLAIAHERRRLGYWLRRDEK